MKFSIDKFHVIKHGLLIALFAFPLFPINIVNVIFILFSLLVLFIYFNEKPVLNFKDFSFYALFILPFIPYIIEFLMYSDNSVIKFELEKKILFFIAPIIFYINSRVSNRYSCYHVIWSFIVSVFILCISTLMMLLYKGALLNAHVFENGAYEIRFMIESFSGLHPTYFGLFIALSALIIIHEFKLYTGKIKIGLIIMLIVLVLMSLIIASKMPLIILFIGALFIIIKQVTGTFRKIKISVVLISSVIFLSILIPSARERIMEIYNYYVHPIASNTLIERDIIFNCSKSIFIKDFVTGIGSRNTQGLIDYCYYWIKFQKGLELHFNSHNQFLTLGISYGIGVLFLFLALLSMLFYRLKTSFNALLFLGSAIACMFTESILERQMGIYFFLFFGLIFLDRNLKFIKNR